MIKDWETFSKDFDEKFNLKLKDNMIETESDLGYKCNCNNCRALLDICNICEKWFDHEDKIICIDEKEHIHKRCL